MQVSVAYSEAGRQIWLSIEVPEDATAQVAINQSGILGMFPHIDLAAQKVGVFGKFVKLDSPLKEGDRVEIYQRITRVLDEDDDDDDD